MFVGLTNTPRDYSWGSRTDIPTLLHRPLSGKPEAEYWLGTHPGSPAVLDGGPDGTPDGAKTLNQLTTLPFIMKVLAAQTSLSLQAHPSSEQAREGFARENAEGIPVDSPNRNYKDALHKPELIYALAQEFDALCGFRPVAETRVLLASLGPDPLVEGFVHRLVDDSSLRDVFEWLISNGPGVPELRARILELAPSATAPEFATVLTLAREFPGDVGVLISLLLNLVRLQPGQAIYLPSGNIHAYQHGLGIEVLAASDNVLRGGLTPKHVDVPELLKVLDFRPLPVPFLEPTRPVRGLTLFRPPVPDFELAVVAPTDAPGSSVPWTPGGEFIALCVDGPITISGARDERQLSPGDAIYGSADEAPLTVSGSGTAFISSASPVSGRVNVSAGQGEK